MKRISNSGLARFIFFGNYFYGFCAVALAIEATLQQNFPLPSPILFLLVFCVTVLYYSRAYVVTDLEGDLLNERSQWYLQNRQFVRYTQFTLLAVVILASGYVLIRYQEALLAFRTSEWLLLLVFPLFSVIYYGLPYGNRRINLRNIGWLKPFIIAFSWAGLVNVYPILFYAMSHGEHFAITFPGVLLFIKNFMYITLLCILFDIKDYAMDYNQQLKTLVVNLGLRKTLFYLIIPLCLLGLGTFLLYASSRNFSEMKILINTIPFLAVIAVAYSMSNRRSIFYYLVVIDGLMLLKAICGSVAMIFF